MAKKPVTIGLIQMNCSAGPEKNLGIARERIAEAASKGAQIVVLPELFLSRYFCQKKDDASAFAMAETIPGPHIQALGGAAKQHGVVLIGGSVFEKTSGGKYYNTCPVFDADGALLGTYRKTHIPEDPLYHEQQYFAPGTDGIKVFRTKFGKIAPLICFDQWFPEAARIAALKGAEILVYPTAIGDIAGADRPPEGDWQEAWELIQRSHAIANNVFVASLNRVGKEDRIEFWGGSFVCGPFGSVLAHGGKNEEILLTECDLATAPAVREAWGFMRNRRPDQYEAIAKSAL